MLSKIGIDDLNNKSFDFFSLIQNRTLITLPNCTHVEEVVSIMVIVEIVDFELIDTIIFANLNMKIKLVYKGLENSMHIHSEDICFYRELELCERIDGSKIFDLYKSRSIDLSINILEISSFIVDKCSLWVYTDMAFCADYMRSYAFAILSKTSDFEKNIYLCFEDGTSMIQITFDVNSEFSNIKWMDGRNFVSYIKSGDISGLYIYNVKQELEELVIMDDSINSYDYIDSQNIILDMNHTNKRGLYLYDRQKKNFKNIIRVSSEIILSDVIYREDLGRLFFIKEFCEKISLCSLDNKFNGFKEHCMLEKKNIHTVYNFPYIVSFNDDNLCFYDYKNNRSFNVLYPDGQNNKIMDFDFFIDKKEMVFLWDDGSIYIFDDKYKKFDKINHNLSGCDIKSVCFSYDSNSIIACINVMGFYNVYSIKREGESSEVIGLYSSDAKIFKRY